MDPSYGQSLKRQYGGSMDGNFNGREKRAAVGVDGNGSSSETIYRLLCPQARTGTVIGKGGSVIKVLREETGARIKIADAVPGIDERVIIISGPDHPDQDWSTAQDGLLRVHARVVEGDDNLDALGPVTTRLLVPSGQIGCLLGKGGSIISQMRKDTGAAIRIMQKDQVPGCALPTDELVQISGDMASVVKALEMISSRLRANPPRDRPAPSSAYSAPPQQYAQLPHAQMPPSAQFQLPPQAAMYGGGGLQHGMQQAPPAASWQSYGMPPQVPPQQMQMPPPMGMSQMAPMGGGFGGGAGGLEGGGGGGGSSTEIVFRVLCPVQKIGSIIGRRGGIIKQLREETGAKMKIADPVAGCEERVIIISGNEGPGATFSSAQEGVFRVQALLLEPDVMEQPALACTSRMLVPAAQVGCLLGKGGAIISEMRRISGANIRLLPKDQLPTCALESDELLQIVGDIGAIRSALAQVTARLRANPPKEGPADHGGVGMAGYSTVTVPVHVSSVGSILGKGGVNIAQIRSISGCKVKLHDSQPGATERLVEIAGAPDQIAAAQGLMQAFIDNGGQPATGY
eukprot:TRINITY_DN38860_c0_g1_i1.p1 TRINITY_DN38860_c0_g1~~TRINITY_DN38860_c0_g1_i1.p1  ORF type:complete len:571 (+),score=97.62 TRINITY_DN38860_c0_g1_i1:165-1877(+)